MEDIISVTHDQFGTIRAVVRDDEPWFVAADVCHALGVTQTPGVMLRIDKRDKDYAVIPSKHGAKRSFIVNIYGLYLIVFRTKSKSAREDYSRWVVQEVVPELQGTIRDSVNH